MRRYLTIAALWLVQSFNGTEAFGQKPNVLFLFVDDLRADLGAYGNAVIQTPNLDRLTKSGYLFTNQYAVVPTCGASRYALLTRQLPKTTAHLRTDVAEQFLTYPPRTEKRLGGKEWVSTCRSRWSSVTN